MTKNFSLPSLKRLIGRRNKNNFSFEFKDDNYNETQFTYDDKRCFKIWKTTCYEF